MYHKKMRELEKPVTTEIHLQRFAKHLVSMAPDELKIEGQGPGRGHMTFIAHKKLNYW